MLTIEIPKSDKNGPEINKTGIKIIIDLVMFGKKIDFHFS